MSTATGTASNVWQTVVGQTHAVQQLQQLASQSVHAYLFVGPEGCGKEEAARAFSTLLITGSDDATTREAKLIVRGAYSDVVEVLREGAAVDKDEADNIVRLSSTTPTESKIKIVIIHELHLMRDSAAVRLLKTIEEPPERMIFILLADQIVPALATINSRCVVVNFVRPDDTQIAAALISEGIKPDLAASVSRAASGNLGRARHLATDKFLVKRQEAFASIPSRLDGTGAQVAALVDELFEHIDEAAAPLLKAQVDELSTLEERVALTGERGSGRKALQDRHKRQLRKFKTDELRSGLATVAGAYHTLVVSQPTPSNSDVYIQAIERIHKAMGVLGLNVNEELVLQSLLLQCPSLMQMPHIAPVN